MITPEHLQSIVDGECSHETRAFLLSEMEKEPIAWRTLALALLEDRKWSNELTATSKLGKESQCETWITSPTSNESLAVASRVPTLTNLAGNAATDGNAIPWLPALAASFLLGVGIYGGSFLPRWSSSYNVPEQPLASRATSKQESVDLLSPAISTYEPDMKMLVSGPNQEKSEIPVYDMKETGHDLFLAKETYEIAKINQRLRREGYELDVRPEYYTGKLNDGRNIVVPVKHVGVRPYGL